MSIEQYLKMELSPDSVVAKDLFARLGQDTNLVLTGVYTEDGTPAYLTAGMSAWYKAWIQPLRQSALREVIETFDAMVIPRGRVRGKLVEHEMDRVELEAFQKMADERMVLETKADIMDVHKDLVSERETYDILVQRHGEAVKWRPVLYWTVLIFMIGVLEGLINFESFLRIAGFTPALSTGSFLVVSGAFAVSAHLVGMIFKQWRDRLGGAVSGTEKMKNSTLLSAAILMFVLAFAFVVYARWALLGDVILRMSQTTGEEVGTREVLRFAGTLIGNVIVYLMGVVWSYIRHDSVPGFSELRRRVELLEARESELLEKHLAVRNRQHIGRASVAKEHLRRAEDAQAAKLPGHHSGRALFDRLREQDSRVVGLLEKYRSAFLEQASKRYRTVIFTFQDIRKLALDTEETMTAEEYAGKPIELWYL